MTETNVTRRDILKTTGSAAVVSGIATRTGAAGSDQTGQVIEAGIRYDIPDNQFLTKYEQDSRPPYTVDGQAERLVVSPGAGRSGSLLDRIGEAGALVSEQPVGPQGSRGLSSGETVSTLPVGLTARMRPRARLSLVDDSTLPMVKIVRNGRRSKLVLEGSSTRQIEPGTDHTIRLDPEIVIAQTSRVTDELSDDETIPEHRRANKIEYGAEQIEVTPVVEVTHHGQLDLISHRIA